MKAISIDLETVKQDLAKLDRIAHTSPIQFITTIPQQELIEITSRLRKHVSALVMEAARLKAENEILRKFVPDEMRNLLP